MHLHGHLALLFKGKGQKSNNREVLSYKWISDKKNTIPLQQVISAVRHVSQGKWQPASHKETNN